MTTFLRLLAENDKREKMASACACLRAGEPDPRVFEVAPNAFDVVPGKPFAYWVSNAVRTTFARLSAFECDERTARQGLATAEDFRFVRTWWEEPGNGWYGFAKGGAFSSYYADVYLMTNWDKDGAEVKAGICRRYPYLNGNAEFVAKNPQFYLRPGLTWPRRTQGGLSLRAMPQGCIFADKGPAAFVADDAPDALLALLALVNSQAFGLLVSLQMAFGSYEVGVIQKTPVPDLNAAQQSKLAALARRAWSLKRTLDTTEETSHAFLLPTALRARLRDYDPPAIEAELARIQSEIDAIAFDLYGFSEADRAAAQSQSGQHGDAEETAADEDAEEAAVPVGATAGLLAWAVGVAFGRFDWRLATGERAAPGEPEPFDPLPPKSPGMLPDGATPFHVHAGILVDDPGHPHDLAHLVEEVLARVDAAVPEDVRRWLQRDFFPFHLQRYSKSRRKAPIYWPLSTTSGSYTLWVYYPSLTSQTLYTAINDFVEPKLKQVGADVTALRNKGAARTRDDEKQFESLQAFELELIELRDTLLKLAPTYKPNHDDGVQICAAPLWPLFRHKPWQKVLKDTWEKLKNGDYDWAHLAMNYWPDRVREKCKTDKSLAIAHGLEDLYEEPEAKPKKTRKKKAGGDE
ncbi:hypothetical protein [Burkholderia multivorans]|uniref:hypothetical protein n=1 Tax=Burkholderia multivorans TaxID=87883 RepID=UPI0007574539|nr:hypothetical protein [Burkholderia multivorans]KVS17859.1 type II restriction endonuclease subunit M [Burkholderia multivorans]MDN8103943.1 type II restriction endonuclease subunit M [Burkholderia multivorans]